MLVNVELLESVEEGCTGPSERRERAKSGSEASRLTACSSHQHTTDPVSIWSNRIIHSSLVKLA